MSLPKEERLKEGKKFTYLIKRGKSVKNNLLVLYFAPGESGKVEAGFTVGRKLGKAVTRNFVKRRMREAYRGLKQYVNDGFYLLFIARRGILDAPYKAVIQGEKDLLKKAGLWEEGEKK